MRARDLVSNQRKLWGLWYDGPIPDRVTAWGPPFEQLQPDIRDIWLDSADAGLDAMMVPTDEIVAHVRSQGWATGREMYEAVIKAAKDGK